MEWGYFNRASSGLINGISVRLFYKSDKFSFNNASQSDLAPYSLLSSGIDHAVLDSPLVVLPEF
jgi:hypothetical protein